MANIESYFTLADCDEFSSALNGSHEILEIHCFSRRSKGVEVHIAISVVSSHESAVKV